MGWAGLSANNARPTPSQFGNSFYPADFCGQQNGASHVRNHCNRWADWKPLSPTTQTSARLGNNDWTYLNNFTL